MKYAWLFSLAIAAACGGTDGPSPDQCATHAVWTGGNSESSLMHPGGTCIACHSSGEGPRYTIAGTVFPTMKELTDCNGSNGANALSVVVTDSNGTVFTLPVNSVGNFFTRQQVSFPFHAKVVASNGKELSMTDAQMIGDCNSCHTPTGANGAPGRIMAPL